MSHQFTILHISDLHWRGSREKEHPRRYLVLADSWQQNLNEILVEGPIDLVCLTGDLADWGKANEYKDTIPLLESLLRKLNLTWERLFLVPGNHDIDRKLTKDGTKKSPEQLAFEELRGNLHRVPPLDISRWLKGGKPPFGFKQEWLDLTLSRQAAYRRFLADIGRAALRPSKRGHPNLGYRIEVRLPSLPFTIQMVGLDSSWLAGNDSDTGRLRLTDGQVLALSRDSKGNPLPGFRLALIHHPLSDLADGDRCRDLLADSVDLLLRGHLHEASLAESADPDRKLRSFAAGCLYEGDRADQYPNSCSVIRVLCSDDGRPQQYSVRLRSYSSRGGHWYDDGSVYRNAPGGRLSITHLASPTLPLKRDHSHEPIVVRGIEESDPSIEPSELTRQLLTASGVSAFCVDGAIEIFRSGPAYSGLEQRRVKTTVIGDINIDARFQGFLNEFITGTKITSDRSRYSLPNISCLPEILSDESSDLEVPLLRTKWTHLIAQQKALASKCFDSNGIFVGPSSHATKTGYQVLNLELFNPSGTLCHLVNCQVIVETSDQYIVLARRSNIVQTHPGCWSCSIEEQMAGDDELKRRADSNVFDCVYRGLNEELGIRENLVNKIKLMSCIVEPFNYAAGFIFYTQVGLSSDEISRFWLNAEDRMEGTALALVPITKANIKTMCEQKEFNPSGFGGIKVTRSVYAPSEVVGAWHPTSRMRLFVLYKHLLEKTVS